MSINEKTISVITIVFNGVSTIEATIKSVLSQKVPDFNYVIVDGGSTDGTLEVIGRYRSGIDYFVSEPDNGFYDALNKAVKAVSTEYYLVLGADDTLDPEAIKNFSSLAKATNADMIVANVICGNDTRKGYRSDLSWKGPAAMITSHSVGLLIKKSLHTKFGMYSYKYPILADGFFIKKVCSSSQSVVAEGSFVAGVFALDGFSNRNLARSITELWHLQVETGENRLFQYVLLQLRLLKNFFKLI